MFQVESYKRPECLSLPLNFGSDYEVFGGPYRKRPENVLGVKMAAEIDEPFNLECPTEDFSIPDLKTYQETLKRTLLLILADQDVYVGCMGGIGRTGLMLAGLAKVSLTYQFPGEQINPIHYVREHYHPHAVETKDQKALIENLDVSALVELVEAFSPRPVSPLTAKGVMSIVKRMARRLRWNEKRRSIRAEAAAEYRREYRGD